MAPYRWKLVKKKGVFIKAFFYNLQSQKWKCQQACSGSGSRSKGSNAVLTTQGGRSLKDYTADCQRGVQSSGLRNQRIRVQGLGVSCPTRDKTATRYINHRGGMRSHHERWGTGSPSPLYWLCQLLWRSSSQVERTTGEKCIASLCKYLLKSITNVVKSRNGAMHLLSS